MIQCYRRKEDSAPVSSERSFYNSRCSVASKDPHLSLSDCTGEYSGKKKTHHKIIERVKHIKWVHYMKENILAHETLYKHSFRETTWKSLCFTIFPKLDKSPECLGICDFSHVWFVISLSFSLVSSKSDKMIMQNCPISHLCLWATTQVDDITVIRVY